jgi:ABC-type phosphate transport system substrate-binding protein
VSSLLRYFLAPFLVLALYAASAWADVVVVVSAKSAITRLTAEQVTKIFLGKSISFPNGINAVPVDQIEGNSIRNEFYARIANKSPSQISAYWTKIIFTGDGYPPKQLENNLEVRNAVANNPNAIGYIDRSAVDGSVRVVLAP